MSRRNFDLILRTALVTVAGALASCGGSGSSNGPPVASINLPAAASTAIGAGTPVAFSASCVDPNADPVYSTWTFPSGTPATSSAAVPGNVTWVTPGTYVVTFQCADSGNRKSALLQRTIVVTDALPPAHVTAVSVQDQHGHAGEGVSDPPAVQVLDTNLSPVPGAQVTFTIDQGGGSFSRSQSLTTTTATADATGVAQVPEWVLGTSGAQSVTASVAGVASTASLTAIIDPGTSHYHIRLRFLSSLTGAQRHAFTDAAERIGRVVTGDVPNGVYALTATDMQRCTRNAQGSGSAWSTAYNADVDDLEIMGVVTPIDGAGNILGQAGPCFLNNSSGKPFLGFMQFDSADLDKLEANGQLDYVILHEMLHVVGFGTLWDNPLLTFTGNYTDYSDPNPKWTGAQALDAFQHYNGGGSWTYVPVEGYPEPAGTAYSHWRESVLKNELMTGILNRAPQTAPLSRTTIGSLADVGYTVDLTQADDFNLATATSLRAADQIEPPLHLENDVLPLAPVPFEPVAPEGSTP